MNAPNGRRVAIIAGCRTPFAKAGTVFRDVPAVDLARHAARELLARSEVDPALVDQVIFGQVVPSALVPNAYPTLERIGGVRCPTLLIHGTADEIVPFAQAEALLAAAPEPKRLARIEGAGHNDIVGFEAHARALAEWIGERLG